MIGLTRTILLLGTAAAMQASLSGCVTSCTGDPRTDSLGCAASNLSNGRYERDTQRLAMRADAAQARAASAQREGSALRQQSATLSAEQSRLSAALARADRELSSARAQLSALEAQGRLSAGELARVRAQLQQVQQLRAQAAQGGSNAEIAALEEEVARLRSLVSM